MASQSPVGPELAISRVGSNKKEPFLNLSVCLSVWKWKTKVQPQCNSVYHDLLEIPFSLSVDFTGTGVLVSSRFDFYPSSVAPRECKQRMKTACANVRFVITLCFCLNERPTKQGIGCFFFAKQHHCKGMFPSLHLSLRPRYSISFRLVWNNHTSVIIHEMKTKIGIMRCSKFSVVKNSVLCWSVLYQRCIPIRSASLSFLSKRLTVWSGIA